MRAGQDGGALHDALDGAQNVVGGAVEHCTKEEAYHHGQVSRACLLLVPYHGRVPSEGREPCLLSSVGATQRTKAADDIVRVANRGPHATRRRGEAFEDLVDDVTREADGVVGRRTKPLEVESPLLTPHRREDAFRKGGVFGGIPFRDPLRAFGKPLLMDRELRASQVAEGHAQ